MWTCLSNPSTARACKHYMIVRVKYGNQVFKKPWAALMHLNDCICPCHTAVKTQMIFPKLEDLANEGEENSINKNIMNNNF